MKFRRSLDGENRGKARYVWGKQDTCGESKKRVGKARYVWGKQDTCGESKIRVEFVNCGDKCGRIRVHGIDN